MVQSVQTLSLHSKTFRLTSIKNAVFAATALVACKQISRRTIRHRGKVFSSQVIKLVININEKTLVLFTRKQQTVSQVSLSISGFFCTSR